MSGYIFTYIVGYFTSFVAGRSENKHPRRQIPLLQDLAYAPDRRSDRLYLVSLSKVKGQCGVYGNLTPWKHWISPFNNSVLQHDGPYLVHRSWVPRQVYRGSLLDTSRMLTCQCGSPCTRCCTGQVRGCSQHRSRTVDRWSL